MELSVDGGQTVVFSDRGFGGGAPVDCDEPEENRRACDLSSLFVVHMLGFNDRVGPGGPVGAMRIEAHGGAGDDSLDGTVNADLLDGGPGQDSTNDGAGNDTVLGGPGDDLIHADPGRDVYAGDEGNDTIYYDARTAGLTITFNGQADDGEAGEGDNVLGIEDALRGSGPDLIAGDEPATGSPAATATTR